MDSMSQPTMMLDRDKDKLKKHHDYIVAELDAQHVLLYLEMMRVLSKYEVDKIYAIQNQKQRTQRLLTILPTKGVLAYQHFRRSLQDRYPHIIEKLDNTGYSKRRTVDTR